MNATLAPLSPARDAEIARLVRLINSHFGCYAEQATPQTIRVINIRTMTQELIPARSQDVQAWLGC